jgi:hypothetical protein
MHIFNNSNIEFLFLDTFWNVNIGENLTIDLYPIIISHFFSFVKGYMIHKSGFPKLGILNKMIGAIKLYPAYNSFLPIRLPTPKAT